MNSLQRLPKKLRQHVPSRYFRRHPILSPSFLTSSFVQKDLSSSFCSWKGFPSPLPLLSIFLQKTLLVVVEPHFRATAITTQRPPAGIIRDVLRRGRCFRTHRMNRRQYNRHTLPKLLYMEARVDESHLPLNRSSGTLSNK